MTPLNQFKDLDELYRAIESGVFRDMYLVYNRKSLDEAESQKNSIGYQRRENTRFVKHTRLPLANITIVGFCTNGVISEKHSGFKEKDDLTISDDGMVQYRIDRPKFQKLVMYLSKGYFKGVVCLCWDRISRNKGDNTVIRKLMKMGVDIHFVTAKYDKSSSGELHMDIDGMFSEHHSRVTSEKVSLTIHGAREDGKCTYRAPIGYLNEGSMDNKPIDPVRGPIIQQMYELYGTGEWSQIALARFATDQGFTTVPMRKRRTKDEMLADDSDEEEVRDKYSRPITANHISRILKNRFYIGEVLDVNGKYIKSESHEALVSVELFNKVQKLLNKKCISKHYTEKLDHPFRGIVRCAQCKRAYCPYPKKGNMYYGSRCAPGCENQKKSLTFKEVNEVARSIISRLHFTKDELEQFEARTTTEIALLDIKRSKTLDKIDSKKKRIREEISYLENDRISLLRHEVYTPEDYSKKLNELRAELGDLQTREQVSDEAMASLVDDVVKLSELIKNVIPIYDFATPHEKEDITRILISELYVDQNSVDFEPIPELKSFFMRENAVCDPLAWLSELYPNRLMINNRMIALESLLAESSV